MKVLLSIKPEYAEKILNGSKHYEFRKVLFQKPNITTVVIYASKPIGRVIGEFQIEGILGAHPKNLWTTSREGAGITKEFFGKYFEGKKKGYAIKVGEVKRYPLPLKLKEVTGSTIPPQSFCYL